MPKIFGFTLLRNGLKYDYPFRESFASLAPISEKIYLALGQSEDGTEAAVSSIPNLVLIPTVWDESLRQGGKILSQQTNIALAALRAQEKSGWGFHLQADELICDSEFEQMKNDFIQAESEGCDAISFRYLHFWQSYSRIAYAKRWYPQEIRAIRLDCPAESYGDAQSFRPVKKIYYSNCHIFHYGHVRDAAAYERKKNEFHRWWHSDSEMNTIIAKSKRRDPKEPVLEYFGPHPKVMKVRRKDYAFPEVQEIFILGNPKNYSTDFHNHIGAKKVHWCMSPQELYSRSPEQVVILEEPGLLFHLRTFGKFRSPLLNKMLSPQARNWETEFRARMLLSEKFIPYRE